MSGAATPSHLGKYEVRATLGRGAMGIVYDGWDPVIDRRVAIKTVRLPDAQDQEAKDSLDRFKREAQAAGRLTHPNVVGVFDYGETAEVAYIVMEFVEGRSLKQILDANQRLPAAEAVRVMGDVLAGLAYSHGRGVIHRDIKPANIMITTEDQAKIADFGIARIEASSMTQAGTVMGTPAYMSPEQFMGQPVDARTDIYSCGIMLYQLLAGERPYEGSMTSIMHKAMTTTPPRPSELAVTSPAALDPVVARAMARRPEDRFGSAAAFAQALLASSTAAPAPPPDADATIVTPPPKPPPPTPAPTPAPAPPPAAKPNRIPLVLAGVAVLAAAAGGAFVFLRPSPEPPRSTPATPAPAAAERPAPAPSTETAALRPAPAPAPALAPASAPISAPASAPVTAPSAPVAAKPELPPFTPAPAAPPETVAPAAAPAFVAPPSAPTPETPPATRPAPQQEAAIAAPPLALPPAATPPASIPVMAAPPPDPASIPCSLVQPGMGLTDAANEPAIRQAVAGLTPRIVDETFCPVLDALRGIGSAPGATLALAQDGGVGPVRDNQLISLHATMPAFAGFLQVAYVQHDRTVAPLVPGPGYPAQTYPARGTIALGNKRAGSPGWLAGPPFGTDMIVAVVSTAPLFAQSLPESQSLDAYLSTLQAAVAALRRRGGTVAVTALPIETVPAR